MKIIFIGRYNQSEILNGPEKFAKRISQLAHSKYHDVIFIQYFFEGTQYGIFKKLFGFEEEKTDTNMTVLRLGIFQIFFRILKFKPQIIHILMFERFATEVFLINLILRAKIIYTVHSVFCFENRRSRVRVNKLLFLKNKICEYLLLKCSDKLVFVSQETVTMAKRYYSINDKKIRIIYNGIDTVFFNSQSDFRIVGPLKIVFYNGLRSGVDRKLVELIEILERIKNFKIELYILGESLLDQKEILNIDIIQVEPLTTDSLSKFLKDKHIYIQSFGFWSFSIMSVEAMASGLLCIVSNEVGMHHIVKNEINGFVYDKNDLDCVVQILTRIINNDYNLEQISKNATQIYLRFSWENVNEKYSELYNQMLLDRQNVR